jgi:uncharacterized membrane protein YeaQ/YmgE (transglycosylase-associated protein family)
MRRHQIRTADDAHPWIAARALWSTGSHRPAGGTPFGRPHLLERYMTFILWLVIGGILGWLASIVMKTNDQQGIILNVIVGIVGAFLGGLLLAPLFGTGTINQSDFSIGSLFVSFLGAIILLAIVNFFRGRRART